MLLDDIKTSGQSQKKLQKLKVLEVIHYMDRLNALKLVKNIHLFYYLLTPACGKKCLYATRSRTSSFFQIGSSVKAWLNYEQTNILTNLHIYNIIRIPTYQCIECTSVSSVLDVQCTTTRKRCVVLVRSPRFHLQINNQSKKEKQNLFVLQEIGKLQQLHYESFKCTWKIN